MQVQGNRVRVETHRGFPTALHVRQDEKEMNVRSLPKGAHNTPEDSAKGSKRKGGRGQSVPAAASNFQMEKGTQRFHYRDVYCNAFGKSKNEQPSHPSTGNSLRLFQYSHIIYILNYIAE